MTRPETPTGSSGAVQAHDSRLSGVTGDKISANRRSTRAAATAAIWVNLMVIIAYRGLFGRVAIVPIVNDWATLFMSVTLQALPFLVLGVVVSAAISSLLPAKWLERALPQRPALAVPVAGIAGIALPGCECSSVPVARRLMTRGVTPAAALTFLLAAPAVNPVVLVATATAFPGEPMIWIARLTASLFAATAVGLVWSRWGSPHLIEERIRVATEASRHERFTDVVVEDFLQAGGFLALGAALVASVQTLVPASTLETVGGSGIVAIATMATLAVLLSVCSEADAFVAAGLPQFSLTARLAFLVIGPMIDLKLFTMQAGTFGRQFALRFAPLTFTVATTSAVIVGSLLL
ncbi:MAG: permease [Acidimicrobiales bacterium]|nr:permease [Acidimicrobiales bacterium]